MNWIKNLNIRDSDYCKLDVVVHSDHIDISEITLYWIRRNCHTNIWQEGYVGITSDFDRRMNDHKNRIGNDRFSNSIKSYGWDTLVVDKIVIGNSLDVARIEKFLRPKENIGWNHCIGGGYLPKNNTETALKIVGSKRKSGYYESEEFKELNKKATYTRKVNGFYESESHMNAWHEMRERVIKDGFYAPDKMKSRAKKANISRRANGFYDSVNASNRAKKSHLTKLENGYYESEEFKSRTEKSSNTKRSNNELSMKPFRLTKEEKVLDFETMYEAAEFLGIPNHYLMRRVKRGTKKDFKGYKTEVILS